MLYDYDAACWRSFYLAESRRPLSPRDDPWEAEDEETTGRCVHRFDISCDLCRACSGRPDGVCPNFEAGGDDW